VHFTRVADDDILLINRREGLPIDAPCQAKQKSEPNDDYQKPTRSDDRTFRLARMPIAGCRGPDLVKLACEAQQTDQPSGARSEHLATVSLILASRRYCRTRRTSSPTSSPKISKNGPR